MSDLIQSNEIDRFQEMPSLDEILEIKFNHLLNILDSHTENIYKEFNGAMLNSYNQTKKLEQDLNNTVQILWGIVNKAQARSAALEAVLLNNGMKLDDLNNEIKKVESLFESQGFKNFVVNNNELVPSPSSPV